MSNSNDDEPIQLIYHTDTAEISQSNAEPQSASQSSMQNPENTSPQTISTPSRLRSKTSEQQEAVNRLIDTCDQIYNTVENEFLVQQRLFSNLLERMSRNEIAEQNLINQYDKLSILQEEQEKELNQEISAQDFERSQLNTLAQIMRKEMENESFLIKSAQKKLQIIEGQLQENKQLFAVKQDELTEKIKLIENQYAAQKEQHQKELVSDGEQNRRKIQEIRQKVEAKQREVQKLKIKQIELLNAQHDFPCRILRIQEDMKIFHLQQLREARQMKHITEVATGAEEGIEALGCTMDKKVFCGSRYIEKQHYDAVKAMKKTLVSYYSESISYQKIKFQTQFCKKLMKIYEVKIHNLIVEREQMNEKLVQMESVLTSEQTNLVKKTLFQQSFISQLQLKIDNFARNCAQTQRQHRREGYVSISPSRRSTEAVRLSTVNSQISSDGEDEQSEKDSLKKKNEAVQQRIKQLKFQAIRMSVTSMK